MRVIKESCDQKKKYKMQIFVRLRQYYILKHKLRLRFPAKFFLLCVSQRKVIRRGASNNTQGAFCHAKNFNNSRNMQNQIAGNLEIGFQAKKNLSRRSFFPKCCLLPAVIQTSVLVRFFWYKNAIESFIFGRKKGRRDAQSAIDKWRVPLFGVSWFCDQETGGIYFFCLSLKGVRTSWQRLIKNYLRWLFFSRFLIVRFVTI